MDGQKTKGSRSGKTSRKKKVLKRLQHSRRALHRHVGSHGNTSAGSSLSPSGGRQGRQEGGQRKRRRRRGKGAHGLETVSGMEAEGSGIMTDQTQRHGMKGQMEETGMKTMPNMEAWHQLCVPVPIIRALSELGFIAPTDIQRQAIPVAMEGSRDVIGAAETGSGKTLAFSIPILSYILKNFKSQNLKRKGASDRRHRGQQERDMQGKIIDLNIVLHEEGEEEEMEEEGGEQEEREEEEKEEEKSEEEEEREEEGEEDEEEKEEEGGRRMAGPGLVTSMDDIPDEEFLKMLGDDDVTHRSHDQLELYVTDESHDTDDTAPPASESTDSKNRNKSHDLDDITSKSCDQDSSSSRKLLSLILAPTRELALQVQTHIKNAAKYTGIKVCVLVGGLAGPKQERVLSQHPPIVVATPGRLWKLMSEGHPHLADLDGLRFLVLDEADRMVEFGHYQELSWILDRVNGAKGAEFRQTFVFSATLTLPRRSSEKKVKVRRRKNLSSQESIDNLISQVGLRENAAVVDLSRHGGTVETLTETRIMCTAKDKDVFLYYFLLAHPGRTLVFVNSINSLQKLRSLLELLKLRPLPLHARMQQRQRLKNYDRFTSSHNGLLVATDVAARGLDFPSVDHVIHYHVPRNSEVYVHRSGRTARARMEGLSVLLVGPEDVTAYRNICRTLNRDDLSSFPIDASYLQALRKRVSIAKKIESSQHKRRTIQSHKDWLVSSAQAMELELDEDWHGIETEPTANKAETAKLRALKAELDSLLLVPLVPCSVSLSYPTRDENHKLLDSIKESQRPTVKEFNHLVTTEKRDALTIAKSGASRRHKIKH